MDLKTRCKIYNQLSALESCDLGKLDLEDVKKIKDFLDPTKNTEIKDYINSSTSYDKFNRASKIMDDTDLVARAAMIIGGGLLGARLMPALSALATALSLPVVGSVLLVAGIGLLVTGIFAQATFDSLADRKLKKEFPEECKEENKKNLLMKMMQKDKRQEHISSLFSKLERAEELISSLPDKSAVNTGVKLKDLEAAHGFNKKAATDKFTLSAPEERILPVANANHDITPILKKAEVSL